jgi:6-pyruvoyltetrahydropterin/6-carboxytetrahydropterin synthase
MKYQVTKTFMFAMAHRLGRGYPHACKNNHGHEYKVEVTLRSENLDEYGMVVDFKDLSERVKGWVMKNWDHATLVLRDDVETLNFMKATHQKHFEFPDYNTTAECMASYLFAVAKLELKDFPVEVVEVAIWETPTSRASYGI